MTALATITGGKIYLNTKYKSKVKKWKKIKKSTLKHSSQISPVNCEVTGPNFTNFSHDIEASFALLMPALR